MHVFLLYGFKIQLGAAFKQDLLNPLIMDDDDWQLISWPDHRDDIIFDMVTSLALRTFLLQNQDWNLYILASTQEQTDPEKSFLFLYNRGEKLVSGCCPDYSTGPVDTNITLPNIPIEISNVISLFDPYRIHWAVGCSY